MGVLKMNFCMPRYLVFKETGIEKLHWKWSRRAFKYKEKIKKMTGLRSYA